MRPPSGRCRRARVICRARTLAKEPSCRIKHSGFLDGGGAFALVGAGVLVNYFDRIILSVSGPQLQHEFGLTTADMGLLFSAFFWSYALLQVPTGLVLDRFGVTLVGRIGSFLWAGATLLITVASGFGGVFAARVVLGVAEAPAFPANSKATGYWFPRQERALSTAIFDAAAKFSNVIGVPVVALVSVTFGWRWGFGFTAALSFLYFLAFLTLLPRSQRGFRS